MLPPIVTKLCVKENCCSLPVHTEAKSVMIIYSQIITKGSSGAIPLPQAQCAKTTKTKSMSKERVAWKRQGNFSFITERTIVFQICLTLSV